MGAEEQQAMDRLYAIDNVPTVRITMSPADRDAVRREQPAGGVCNFDSTGGSRYTWRKAATVEISGTDFPATTTFTDVGVKKKSFCGSVNNEKPCLHIDFGRFSATTSSAAADLIGTRYLTLDNSVELHPGVREREAGRRGCRHRQRPGCPRQRRSARIPFISAEAFKLIPWGTDQVLQPQHHFTMGTDGLIALVSGRTALGVTSGSDPTPGGRPRVHQDGDGSRLSFY